MVPKVASWRHSYLSNSSIVSNHFLWVNDLVLQETWDDFTRPWHLHRRNYRTFHNPNHLRQFTSSWTKAVVPEVLSCSPPSNRLRLSSKILGKSTPIRHGSSVPGPLEARRRARRRLTGLASFNQSENIDPPVLMGINEKGKGDWDYTRPGETSIARSVTSRGESSTVKSIFDLKNPSQLVIGILTIQGYLTSSFFAPSNNPQHLSPEPLSMGQELIVKRESSWFRAPQEADLEKSRLKVENSTISSTLIIQSENAFKKILADQQLHVLLAFLENRDLNPPGTKNPLRLLRHIYQNPTRSAEKERVEEWIKRQIQSGYLSEESITRGLHSLAPSRREANDVHSWRACIFIYNVLRFSKRQTFKDLKPETIKALLKAVAYCSQTEIPAALSIGLEVLNARIMVNDEQDHLHTAHFLRHFFSFCERSGVAETSMPGIPNLSVEVAGFLKSLPQDVAHLAITSLLLKVKQIQHVPEAQQHLMSQEHWRWLQTGMRILINTDTFSITHGDNSLASSRPAIEYVIAQSDPETIALYLRRLEDMEIHTFLSRRLLPSWFPEIDAMVNGRWPRRRIMNLSASQPSLIPPQSNISEPMMCPLSTSYYLELAEFIHQHQLGLFDSCLRLVFRLLSFKGNKTALLAITRSLTLKKRYIPLATLYQTFDFFAKSDPRFALSLCASDFRPQMADWPGLGDAISRCTEIPLKILHGLRNVLFRRLAAPTSRSRHLQKKWLKRSPYRQHHRRFSIDVDRHPRLISLLAERFVASPELTPNQALRRALSLFKLLMHDAHLLRPEMARSVITAGLIRPLSENRVVPFARQRYALCWVRATEGESAAAGARDQAEEWKRWIRTLKAEAKSLTASSSEGASKRNGNIQM